jgi:hypothetical protein
MGAPSSRAHTAATALPRFPVGTTRFSGPPEDQAACAWYASCGRSRPRLMLLADVSRSGASSGSANAVFTIAWHSSNVPETRRAVTFSANAPSWWACRDDTRPSG